MECVWPVLIFASSCGQRIISRPCSSWQCLPWGSLPWRSLRGRQHAWECTSWDQRPLLPIIYWQTIIFICKLGLRSRTYEKLASFVVHIYGADSLFWILEFPFESNFSKCTTPSSAPLFPQCTAKQSLVTLSTKNHLNVILQLSCQKRLPGFGLTSYFFLPCCALWVDRPCCLTLAPLLAAAVQLTSGLDMCPGPHLHMRQTSSWRKPRLTIRLRLLSCSTSAA